MKIFGLCALAFMIITAVSDIFSLISFRGLLKRTEEKYQVEYKEKSCLWLILSGCWVVICIVNYFTQKTQDAKEGYFYLALVWAIAFLIQLIHVFALRYVYLTKNGMILYQVKHKFILSSSFLPAEECSYQLKQSELTVFQEEKKKFALTIFTHQDEIKEILENCYVRKSQ